MPGRKQHVPWTAAGRATEIEHSADEVVRSTGWVFNNETGQQLTLADENVNIEMISTSTIRISVVIPTVDVERAARSLHTAFGLDSGQAYSAPLPERK